MTIECYYSECKYHGTHDGEEGPFCFEYECRATPDELDQFAHIRRNNDIKIPPQVSTAKS